jgi:hypothetical protein
MPYQYKICSALAFNVLRVWSNLAQLDWNRKDFRRWILPTGREPTRNPNPTFAVTDRKLYRRYMFRRFEQQTDD